MPGSQVISKEFSPQQEARAKLRESFLRALNELQGEQVNILTYELTTLQATFSGWNPSNQELLVKDLKTPASISVPSALIRFTDVLAIQFERQFQLP